ncbi:MAG: transposase [Planctomycetes bacterium]|nr:transposase [Planctomycetota bacterium]
MTRTRYRESRILVRRINRLPKESLTGFRQKVARLRQHFECFNRDTADLCQWLMGLRKDFAAAYPAVAAAHPESFGTLGNFLLEPAAHDGGIIDEKQRDRWRLRVCDDVMGYRACGTLDGHPLPDELRDAMERAAAERPYGGSRNCNAYRLIERLLALEPQHRLVLLKSAAEWVVARYQRGMENWNSAHKAWADEKDEWERAHPGLTPEIRDLYRNVYKQLSDPDRDDKPGLRRKNPRICPYERLRQNTDNCCYAGQKGHGPLCWKFVEFTKTRQGFNRKAFCIDVERLLKFCSDHNVSNPANAFLSPSMPGVLFADVSAAKHPQRMRQFKANWDAYLHHMGLNATTVMHHGRLPHCMRIGKTHKDSECQFNPHTDYCREYQRALTNPDNGLDDHALSLESLYREWRMNYVAGPSKPQFRYPSAHDLPMPKVFGEGFFEVDFNESILRLHLDDMAPNEWIEFGFTPWPRKYKPSRREISEPGRVTSAHLNFVGTRARVGFRFAVQHKQSRCACSQDELDLLRSRKYPRQAQDQAFLDEARERLSDRFPGDFKNDLRILAVDMGMTGAHAAVYHGNKCLSDLPIPIVKINKLYDRVPRTLVRSRGDTNKVRGPIEMATDPQKASRIVDARGLRKEHVGRHLNAIADGAAAVAAKRQQETDDPMQTLRDSDFRGLKRHIRWMIRDWARLNARQIVDLAEGNQCDLIVFESLRGSRKPSYHLLGPNSERQKAEQVLYAYGQVRRKVTEKAVERGMRTVTVPYHKSSQVCHQCGKEQSNLGLWRKNKRDGKFVCDQEQCDQKSNSDANAARVLARVFLGEITLPKKN